MRRYAITDRSLLPPGDSRFGTLLRQTAFWAADGFNYIQLREKDLLPGELAELSREMLKTLHGSRTRLLLNSRLDIAVATAAHGVHLTARAGELTPAQVREVYAAAGLLRPVVSVSCHTLAEVEAAAEEADLILFAPVFEKTVGGKVVTPGQGLGALRAACVAASPVPVYALGGVTEENAAACLKAGAAGVAGIRLFCSG